MSQPHHHVFNALQQSIVKGVNVQAILPHLITRGVIPPEESHRYESKSGMKILIGFLRNKSFEEFLTFVECIFITQQQDPSKSKALPVIDAIIKAVEDFDQRNNTNHAEKIESIKSTYITTSGTESVGAEAEPHPAFPSESAVGTRSDGK